MIVAAPIGWMNTGLPLVLLVGAAIVLPRVLARRDTASHLAVIGAIGATVLSLIVAGAVIFAFIYAAQGSEVRAAFGENALVTILFFAQLSAKFALAWAPILALVWFVKAQAVEKQRGEDIVRLDGR